jgi:hypothetical protein
VDRGNDQKIAIIAVPFDAVEELERENLASVLPVSGGAAIEAIVMVGTDSAMLVTLLQAPDAVRGFAAWIRNRCLRESSTIDITAKRGDRRVHLTVGGDIDVRIVADFLAAALADERRSPD